MGEILVKATPLIFTSLAFAFTFKANLFNIGAQGQFYMGSIVAVAISLALGDVLPTIVIILLVRFVRRHRHKRAKSPKIDPIRPRYLR